MENDNSGIEIELDYTDLRPDATLDDVKKLCDTAVEKGYYSVCVNPIFVKPVKDYITHSFGFNSIKVCGFFNSYF